MKEWLKGILIDCLQWFLECFEWLPKKIYSEIMAALGSFLNSIPAPEFMHQAKNLLSQWGPIAGYFFDVIQFNWGFSLVVSAMTLKFCINRIPFIGGR
jgi:hypothetical protein